MVTTPIRDLPESDSKEVFEQGWRCTCIQRHRANVTGLAAMARPHQAVICTENAHINVDECGAVERFAGCRLYSAIKDGKLKPEQIQPV